MVRMVETIQIALANPLREVWKLADVTSLLTSPVTTSSPVRTAQIPDLL